jgi:hypothetical protein
MGWYVVAVKDGKVVSVRSRPGLKVHDKLADDLIDAPDFVFDLAGACPYPSMTDAEAVIDEYGEYGVTEHLVMNTPSNAPAVGVVLDVYSQAEFDKVRIEGELTNGG